MPVYVIIEICVDDDELYSTYVRQVAQVVESHGGRYLVRGGRVTSLAGDWHPERIVLIEFKNREALQRCFSSDAYLRLASLRERSTRSRAIVVKGYSPPE